MRQSHRDIKCKHSRIIYEFGIKSTGLRAHWQLFLQPVIFQHSAPGIRMQVCLDFFGVYLFIYLLQFFSGSTIGSSVFFRFSFFLLLLFHLARQMRESSWVAELQLVQFSLLPPRRHVIYLQITMVTTCISCLYLYIFELTSQNAVLKIGFSTLVCSLARARILPKHQTLFGDNGCREEAGRRKIYAPEIALLCQTTSAL